MARHADFTTGTYTGISPANVNASGGYAETLAGALTSFAANTLRRTDKGLLVEPSKQNVVLNSAVGGWSSFNNGSGTVSITANAAAAPDGSTTAARVDISRSSTGDFAIAYQDISGAPAGTYAPAIWLKARTAGDVGKVIPAVLHGGSQRAVTSITLTAAWVRYPLGSQASPAQMFIGYAESGWTGSNMTGAASFLAWGGQAELNSLSSDILTTSAFATRSADAVSFTVPSGVTVLTFTFDDNSTQTASVTPGATYTIPTSLNRPYIKYIDGNGAAGPTYTLAVTSAGVAVAGNGVSLKRARRVAVAVAAVAVAAQSVRLLRARRVAIGTSAVAVSAQPVALSRSLRVAVVVQSVTVTASPVLLAYQRRIAVAPASVSVAGQSVALRWSHHLAVQSVAVTIAANPVTLTKGGVGQLVVTPASVAVVASPVRMIVSRRLTVAAAPVSVSGAPVGLVRSLRLMVTPAAITVAGQAVQLRRARTLPVVSASISIASAQVGLRALRRIIVAPGAIVIAAQPVALTKQGAITLPTPGRRTAHGAGIPRLAKSVGTSRTARGTV